MRIAPRPVQALIVILTFASTPTWALDARDTARLLACINKADTKPNDAYEDGLIWRNQGGGALAGQCVAVAMIGQGRVEEGAQRLFDLAYASDAGDQAQRATFLGKAGNAWLLSGNTVAAKASLSKAIELFPADSDLRIDRARALTALGEWKAAEGDLDLAIAKQPQNTLALSLRAEARLEQEKFAEAQADIEAAYLLGPKDIGILVLRGRIKEAQRLAAKG